MNGSVEHRDPTRIALIGLPGSGKTTIGRNLARKLRLEFCDTDQIIQSRLGLPIRDFFEENGEAAFREIEANLLSELCALDHCVISTGGGIILREMNRTLLRSNFCCVYLKADPQYLIRRLKSDKTRPLLQTGNPMQALTNLYKDRHGLYEEVAHVTAETGSASVSTLVDNVERQLATCQGHNL